MPTHWPTHEAQRAGVCKQMKLRSKCASLLCVPHRIDADSYQRQVFLAAGLPRSCVSFWYTHLLLLVLLF